VYFCHPSPRAVCAVVAIVRLRRVRGRRVAGRLWSTQFTPEVGLPLLSLLAVYVRACS